MKNSNSHSGDFCEIFLDVTRFTLSLPSLFYSISILFFAGVVAPWLFNINTITYKCTPKRKNKPPKRTRSHLQVLFQIIHNSISLHDTIVFDLLDFNQDVRTAANRCFVFLSGSCEWDCIAIVMSFTQAWKYRSIHFYSHSNLFWFTSLNLIHFYSHSIPLLHGASVHFFYFQSLYFSTHAPFLFSNTSNYFLFCLLWLFSFIHFKPTIESIYLPFLLFVVIQGMLQTWFCYLFYFDIVKNIFRFLVRLIKIKKENSANNRIMLIKERCN